MKLDFIAKDQELLNVTKSLLKFVLEEFSNIDPQEDMRMSEMIHCAEVLIKYPNQDPQFKKRRWLEDWSEFIDLDFSYGKYTVLPVEALEPPTGHEIRILKKDIELQLELLGIKKTEGIYCINVSICPKELLNTILENYKDLNNIQFDELGIDRYRRFLEEQKELGNI